MENMGFLLEKEIAEMSPKDWEGEGYLSGEATKVTSFRKDLPTG